MALRDYVIRRIIQLLISIFLFMTILFFIFRLMPGDPTALLIEESEFSSELREALRKMWGLDRPIHEQYFIFIRNLLVGDLGISFIYNKPVADVIISRKLLNTLALLISSHGMALLLGMILGVWAAWRRGRAIDISTLVTALVLYTIPVFWLGLVFLMIFAVRYRMFPLGGTITAGLAYGNILEYMFDYLRHLFLPMITITLIRLGADFLIMRNTMITVTREDFVTTALAKGLPEKIVVWKHAARNAMLPIVTLAGLDMATVVSGAVLTESVFSWDGIGRLTYEAAIWRDYPILQGIFFIFVVVVLLANFITDLMYAYLDPRVRYE